VGYPACICEITFEDERKMNVIMKYLKEDLGELVSRGKGVPTCVKRTPGRTVVKERITNCNLEHHWRKEMRSKTCQATYITVKSRCYCEVTTEKTEPLH